MKKEKLAIFGGKKAINTDHPHWQWPPHSQEREDAIMDYMKYGKLNQKDYPEIVEEFEKNFAGYQKRKYALTTNSGTSSLYAAFFAVGLDPGDEVLAPTLTFHATATPILQNSAIPVLVDCEADTGNIVPVGIEKRITNKTKAVVITHLWGHPCEMGEILEIIREHSLLLIEDCSHAHGSTYKGDKVGTFGDIACFSLANTKILAAGEAGVLVTDRKELFERALLISDLGGRRLMHELTIDELKIYNETGFGHKHRIHPHAAVLANVELQNLHKYIKLRYDKLDYLSEGLKNIPGIKPPITRKHVTRGAYFGYRPFYNKKELNNLKITDFIKIMNAEGMEVRQSGNKPLHQLPLFDNLKNEKVDFRNSEKFYNSSLSLPTFTFEDKRLIDEYISAFKKVCTFLSENVLDIDNQDTISDK